MDMNVLKHLAFIKTVEYGSFTRAAQVLNYSQSGISRMISDLEQEWHLTLLERSKSGVKLTSDGQLLLDYAKELCDGYQKLQMQVDDIRGVKKGTIRIGTFSSVATHWLPNIIKAFQKDYPGINYELLLGDYVEIEEWIATGRVDCGFLRLPTCPEFETILLEQDNLRAILREDHPLAKLQQVPLEALCQEPFMLQEKGGKSDVTLLLEKYHLSPRVHFTTWDDYAVMSMVASGLGVSILPELILRKLPFKVAVKELDVPAPRQIGFVLRERKSASIAVKRFLEYLHYRNE